MIKIVSLLVLSVVVLLGQTLTLGIFSYRSSEKILKEYQPIADHLSSELNATIVIKPLSQENLEREVREGKIDIIATNPTRYLSLRTQGRITGPIATLIKRYGKATTPYLGGVIITRANRGDIRTLGDLKDKTIAIPGKKYLGGYQTQAYELISHGIDMNQNVSIVKVSSHRKVVHAVVSGKADVGFIRSGIIEEMERDDTLDPKDLFVLNEQHISYFPFYSSTHLYPEWSIAASQTLPVTTVSKIAVALYNYQNSKEGYDVIAGFTIPGDYGAIDNLARMLRIPPYDHPPTFTLHDIWVKYGATIFIVSALTLLFILVVVWLIRKMHFQKAYVRSILDASPSPMVVTDGKHLIDTNKALLVLLGYETLEEFKSEHDCVCDFFEEGETDEYLLEIMDDQTWIKHVLEYPNREHKVKMRVSGKIVLFKVDASVAYFAKEVRHIVLFTNISSIVIQSNTDVLTGLANRLHFDLLFTHAILGVQRDKIPLSLIFFDIDHFKNVNDNFGHLAGDEVLRHIARLVESTLRKSDFIARWGGEEFIILLPNTDLAVATHLAQNLRKTIALEKFVDVGHLTCSFGVTQLGEDEKEETVLVRIDTLLYQAKESGRNTVVSG